MLDERVKGGRFCSIDEISDSIAQHIGDVRHVEEDVVRKPTGVKTRFLGFTSAPKPNSDETIEEELSAESTTDDLSPLGRLVVVGGPGRGKSFPIATSFTRIGRGDDQEVQLAFGDSSISRDCHATIVHYGERNGFVIRDGLKVNPVLLNDRTVKGDEALNSGDLIQLGETTLLFMTFETD